LDMQESSPNGPHAPSGPNELHTPSGLKGPLALAVLLWSASGFLAWKGLWWPLWAMLGLGAIALFGGIVLIAARRPTVPIDAELDPSRPRATPVRTPNARESGGRSRLT